jgi:CubicO group peptidase (beta-lactamase class C family)
MLRPLARLSAAVVALGLCLSGTTAVADDGPVVGTPPPGEAAAGWLEGWTDGDYWLSYLHDVLVNGHVNVPYPADPVKPEAFLPNVPVADGRYVSPLPVAHRDLSRVRYTFGGQTKTIRQFVRTTRTDQVVLVHDGRVVGEFYANGFTADTRHQAWSVTKTFVAAVVGIARHEGLVRSLRDPIERYVPALRGTEWEGVSIRDILQMESGVHWDEGTPVLAVNTQVEQWRDLAADLFSGGTAGKTRNEFLATLPSMGYEPGTRFSYNSGNTQVLAWMLERLYGRTFERILQRKLWRPMGADGDAVMTSDRVGSVVASHGLFARPHDYARFGELLRRGGRTSDGKRVLPRAWVRAMTTMTRVSGGQYGLQTWAHPVAAPDAYSASGFQGQKITVLPSDCLTAVRMSHAFGGDLSNGVATEFYADEWQTLLRAVADELGGCRRR